MVSTSSSGEVGSPGSACFFLLQMGWLRWLMAIGFLNEGVSGWHSSSEEQTQELRKESKYVPKYGVFCQHLLGISCLWVRLSSANEGLDCSVTLPDSPTMFQQTRSSGPAAKLKTALGHHPTGDALEADLSPHGSIRSAGTREYRSLILSSWLGTDSFGGKSQRRDATADRFASWWRWTYLVLLSQKVY